MDPLPVPSNQPALPAKRGGCCCAGGCATMLVIAVIGLALLIGATWYFCTKAISTYTSSAPTEIRMDAPNDAQFAAANTTLEQMHAAAAQNQAGTFELTAADLNALIARHPAFKELRNKVHVGIEGGNMLLDASVPLSTVSLPGLKRRWFNGSAKLGLEYDDGSFNLALRSLTANGREIPLSVLPALDTTFDESVNTVFKNTQRDSAEEELWRHVRSISIVGDKVVVTTKPAEASAAQ